MIRRPPRSTLFPTRRSSDLGGADLDDVGAVLDIEANGSPPLVRIVDHALLRAVLDRKSTRLNSSHLGISYAVFCLKKKNVGIHSFLSNTLVMTFGTVLLTFL